MILPVAIGSGAAQALRWHESALGCPHATCQNTQVPELSNADLCKLDTLMQICMRTARLKVAHSKALKPRHDCVGSLVQILRQPRRRQRAHGLARGCQAPRVHAAQVTTRRCVCARQHTLKDSARPPLQDWQNLLCVINAIVREAQQQCLRHLVRGCKDLARL